MVDFRNNVIYNWMNNNIYGGEKGRYNIVKNYFKPAPATKSSRSDQIVNPWSPFGQFYVSGNVVPGHEAVTTNNSKGVNATHLDSVLVSKEFEVEKITMQSAEKCYQLVLAYAGASLKRDPVDDRIIREVRDGKSGAGRMKNGIIDSQQDVGGWPILRTLQPPSDIDSDGIPDAWERTYGLDPENAADARRRTLQRGYDNIEVYLNDLVKRVGL